MKNSILKFSFIFCFVTLVLNCATNNHFNIRIRDQNIYNEINQLMREIYQKAKDGDVDFFRPFVQREFEESAARSARIARQFNDDVHIESSVPSDDFIISATKDMMRQFVAVRIYRTYKNRAFLAYNGIFLIMAITAPEELCVLS